MSKKLWFSLQGSKRAKSPTFLRLRKKIKIFKKKFFFEFFSISILMILMLINFNFHFTNFEFLFDFIFDDFDFDKFLFSLMHPFFFFTCLPYIDTSKPSTFVYFIIMFCLFIILMPKMWGTIHACLLFFFLIIVI